MRLAIIAITGNGVRIGATLQRSLPGSTLFVLEKHAAQLPSPEGGGLGRGSTAGNAASAPTWGDGGGDGIDVQSFPSLQPLVVRLWPSCSGLVFIMATGIVVRTIAPLLQSKATDPAVVAIDDAGTFAVSLLSGHLGGANQLANRCAAAIGCTPVITTATDVNDLPSFDMLAKAQGWLVDDLSRVKVLNALLLEGKEIAVVDRGDAVRAYCAGKGKLTFYDDVTQAAASGASGCLFVTNRIVPERAAERALVLRPVDLCLGIGCNRGTSCEEIESVVAGNLERLSLSFKSVRCIATAQAKGDEAGLLAFATKSGIPIRLFESEELNGVDVPSPPSGHAFAAIGARGVAEPAAVLAAEGGRLLLEKVKDGNVTLAIAETAA